MTNSRIAQRTNAVRGETREGGFWEFKSSQEALLQLAGNASREVYLEDRHRRADVVRALCRVEAGQRGFEIGSGDGLVARLLAPNCGRIDCSDVSDSFLQLARESCRDVKNVFFHKIEGHYVLDYLQDESFDFGFALNVFIHLNPYAIASYLLEVTRLLKPGGIFYFDTCSFDAPTMPLFFEHLSLFREQPSRIFGLLNFNHPLSVQRIVEACGLKTLDARHMQTNGWHEFLVGKDRRDDRSGA